MSDIEMINFFLWFFEVENLEELKDMFSEIEYTKIVDAYEHAINNESITGNERLHDFVNRLIENDVEIP